MGIHLVNEGRKRFRGLGDYFWTGLKSLYLVDAVVLGVLLTIHLVILAVAPETPLDLENPILPPPTNAVVLTSITTVYTNLALKTPDLDFQRVTVYGTNVFKGCLLIAWAYSRSTNVTGYLISYGKISGASTNFYAVRSNINVVAFYRIFETNEPYWFFVQATNTLGEKSDPSNVIVGSPLRP